MTLDERIDVWVELRRDDLLRFLSALVRTPSVVRPPEAGELACQRLVWRRPTARPQRRWMYSVLTIVPELREHPLFFGTWDGMPRPMTDRPDVVGVFNGSGGEQIICSPPTWTRYGKGPSGGATPGRSAGRVRTGGSTAGKLGHEMGYRGRTLTRSNASGISIFRFAATSSWKAWSTGSRRFARRARGPAEGPERRFRDQLRTDRNDGSAGPPGWGRVEDHR